MTDHERSLEIVLDGTKSLNGTPLVRRGLGDLLRAQERVLSFPTDRAVGWVFARDRNGGDHDWEHPAWERVGAALGEIRIGAGKEIWFEAESPGRRRLSSYSAEEQEKLLQIQNIGMYYSPDGELMVQMDAEDIPLETLVFGEIDYLGFFNATLTDDGWLSLGQLTNLVGLNLLAQELPDGALVVVDGMHKLEELNLGLSGFSDENLAHIRGLKTLRKLTLTNPEQLFGGNLTDAGLIWLRDLVSLRHLELRGAHITSSGLASLRWSTALESLDLSETQVSNTCWWHLQHLNNLHHLDLSYTRVGDAFLQHAPKLAALESLDLSFTQVTDAGMSAMRTLYSLSSLSLVHNQITDAAAPQLAALQTLRKLDLSSCHLSEHVVDMLRQALPECEIRFERPRQMTG